MGFAEKKERAKAFKQETAKVLAQQLEQGDLFADKALETIYAVECLREPEDAPMQIGDPVKLVDMRDRIDVYIKTNCVGFVIPSHTDEIRARYKLESCAARSVAGQISDISAISDTFVVMIIGK